MLSRITTYILFALGTLQMCYAQVNKRQVQLITIVGDDYFNDQQYMNAMYYYKAAFAENPEYVKAQFQIAECYRLTDQLDSALHHYRSIVENDQDFRYPLARYYLASTHQSQEKRLQHYKIFVSLMEEHAKHTMRKYRDFYEKAKLEINGLE